jgi:hypothetical protein
MAISIIAFLSTIYIKFTLSKNMIFNGHTFRVFVIAIFVTCLLYVGLAVYFIVVFFNHTGFNILKFLEGARAISALISDSTTRNVIETLFTFLLFIGLYGILVCSNLIEDEIKRLDMLRAKRNNQNS